MFHINNSRIFTYISLEDFVRLNSYICRPLQYVIICTVYCRILRVYILFKNIYLRYSGETHPAVLRTWTVSISSDFSKKYYLIGQKYVQKILSDTFKKFAFKHLFFYSSVKKSGICLFLTGSETLLISFMYF